MIKNRKSGKSADSMNPNRLCIILGISIGKSHHFSNSRTEIICENWRFYENRTCQKRKDYRHLFN